jgi:predicted transport protein
MVLFSIKWDKLKKVHRIDFKLEKNIQKITEENIGAIFGLDFKIKPEEDLDYIMTLLRQSYEINS